MKLTRKRARSKGFAIITTTLTLTFTVLLAGLGFDVGMLYLIRTKLQGALDAAALAAVRALAQNGDMNNAKTIGTEFLIANFPNNYMGASTLSLMPLNNAVSVAMVDKNGNAGTAGSTATAKLVTVTAGVTAPLYFLRATGANTTNITLTAQATRQGVLIMMVLDASGSMQNPINGTPACTYAQTDARTFLGYSQFDPDIDRIGVVAFGGNTFTVAPTADFQSPRGTLNTTNAVYTALGNFSCHGNTNTSEGMQKAYSAIQTFYGGAGAAPDRANVVVLMTDGAPNGFTADWSTQLTATTACRAASSGGLTGYVARETPNIEGVFNTTPNPSGSGTNQGTYMGGATVVSTTNGRCSMTTSGPLNWNTDFTSVPTTDIYGNTLVNSATTYVPSVSSQVATVQNNASAQQQFLDISKNAADGTATRLRSDSQLRITIYSIALHGNETVVYDRLDYTLLQRMANAQVYANYDPRQPVGAYFYAQDATNLATEFAAVASEISARLSK